MSSCPRMVARWVGSPEEPDRVRVPCGRPVKFRVTTVDSPHVSVKLCARHTSSLQAVRSILSLTVEQLP